MIAAANFSNASWMSKHFSTRIRSLQKPANHPCVLSTTQRCLPSFSLLSIPLFAIRLSQIGQLIPVQSDATILEALFDAGVDVPYSCMSGICGMCITGVLGGVPNHGDQVLSEVEKTCGEQIILCCSHAKSPELTLAL